MAQKRKTKLSKKCSLSNSVNEDDDSRENVVSVSKRKKQDVLDISNDTDNPQVLLHCYSTSESSTSTIANLSSASISTITDNEIPAEHDSFHFIEDTGPQCSLTREAKPIEYFDLFFDSSLLTLMVRETNRYADELLQLRETDRRSRITMWKPITALEMKAFIAVLLEMGITKRPTIFSYWAENSRNIPWFSKMFSRNRFQLILRFFHLINNKECFPLEHEKYDPCAKFIPIVEHVNRIFKLYYKPRKELSIEESLIGTICHSSITRQHLPNDKDQWDIKFWMLCDASSKYCLHLYCYRSAKTDNTKSQKRELGHDIIVNLLEQCGYLNKGYHVFVGNYFSSFALAKYLYSKGTYLTGTIRNNRKDLPNDIKKVNVNEKKYVRDGDVVLCAYREKKTTKNPVLLISTKTSDENVTVIKKRNGNGKPCIVNFYNHSMGGIDESDKMLYMYLDEQRTVKYWKKVTFNIISRMVLNSYLLYKEIVRRKAMTRLEFISNIISEIECEWMQERKQQLINTDKRTFGLMKLPGRNLRQCVVCSNKDNGIKRSNLICVQCKKGIHPLCLDKHVCFKSNSKC